MTVYEPPALVIPDLYALINTHLRTQYEAEQEREIVAGKTWRGSKLGYCLRRQYLEFGVKQPKLRGVSDTTLRKWAVGKIWGEAYLRWYSEMGLVLAEEAEMYADDLDVGAHADFILGSERWQCGVEVKSVHSAYFWYRKKNKETTATFENMMQGAIYDILKRREGVTIPWLVQPTSKDDLFSTQDLVTEKHRKEALRRLEALNTALRTGEAPPCTCLDPKGEWGGGGWKMCDYYPPEFPTGKNDKPADVECCALV